MVQQRVYLAKYMTKVDVPSDFRTDPEINQILEEVCKLVAFFNFDNKYFEKFLWKCLFIAFAQIG